MLFKCRQDIFSMVLCYVGTINTIRNPISPHSGLQSYKCNGRSVKDAMREDGEGGLKCVYIDALYNRT